MLFKGTLRSLLQHYSSKASVLQHSTFFIVQLSHPYMTTEKNITLAMRTFVGKVMFLLFSKYAVQVYHSFSSKERLLISWLQSLSTVILDPKKIKFVTVYIVSTSILP